MGSRDCAQIFVDRQTFAIALRSSRVPRLQDLPILEDVQSVWSACLSQPLKDLSFLCLLDRASEGSLIFVDACQKFWRKSRSCGCMPEELFKEILFLWMLARRSFQGSLVLAVLMVVYTGMLTLACQQNLSRISLSFVECLLEALKDIVLAVIMVTCRDSQNAFVCKFDHPNHVHCKNDIVNSFWQGSLKEKKERFFS